MVMRLAQSNKRQRRTRYPLYALVLCLMAHVLTTSTVLAQTTSTISISSETRSIYLGDSVILDIESTGLIEPLDVTLLKQSPAFLRETTGTRIAVIGGKVVEIAIRRMEFIPLKEGTLLYGPLTGENSQGKVISNSIAVDVQAALNADWQPSDTDLIGEIRFSNNQPVVGEQIVVDIILKHKYQIANEQFSLPEFTEFDVLKVYEQRRTIESNPQNAANNSSSLLGHTDNPDVPVTQNESAEPVQSANEWRQVAWRLLVHPKRSGTIELGALSWAGTMIKSRSQRGDFNKTINTVAMQVQPTPANRPEWWLPATSVKVSDSWSKDVRTLSAGDEIIRTITFTAHHILSNQVPNIEPYPTRALTSTLIRSNRDHTLNNNHTIATGVFEFRMVAQSPIPVFLDTVRVPWWNVTTGTHEEAIIPARRINVGLPDRADLLADLAINHSRLSRWIFKLRSYARWQPMLITLGSLLIIAALYPLMRDGVRFDRTTRRQRKWTKQLVQLQQQQDWHGMYRKLNQLKESEPLDTQASGYRQLMSKLQSVLFAGNEQASEQLTRTRIRLIFKPDVIKQSAPLVSKL